MCFFTRLLKDNWMLPAKTTGVVKIYQFQVWLADHSVSGSQSVHLFCKFLRCFLLLWFSKACEILDIESLEDTRVSLLKHNHIFSLISDLCIWSSLYLCLVKWESWPYKSYHAISVLCILCGDYCANYSYWLQRPGQKISHIYCCYITWLFYEMAQDTESCSNPATHFHAFVILNDLYQVCSDWTLSILIQIFSALTVLSWHVTFNASFFILFPLITSAT